MSSPENLLGIPPTYLPVDPAADRLYILATLIAPPGTGKPGKKAQVLPGDGGGAVWLRVHRRQWKTREGQVGPDVLERTVDRVRGALRAEHLTRFVAALERTVAG